MLFYKFKSYILIYYLIYLESMLWYKGAHKYEPAHFPHLHTPSSTPLSLSLTWFYQQNALPAASLQVFSFFRSSPCIAPPITHVVWMAGQKE
jgi:hypothetical protein